MNERKHEEQFDEEDGTLTVHQLITEAYQSGIVDERAEEETTRLRQQKNLGRS